MNALLRLHKDSPLAAFVPLKYLIYSAAMSNIAPFDFDGVRYGASSYITDDIYDFFSSWSEDEIYNSLKELGNEGIVFYDEDGRIFLGEYRGRKFFPFEVKNSLFDSAFEFMSGEIKKYGMSKSAKDKSRSRYIKEQIDKLIDRGVENMQPSDFTDLHSYLYEVYTGGEIYTIRNKVEYYQTSNMLKAYDRFTVFALIVEATLRYDKYRKNGVPTLTNVACMKDDVFRSLTKSSKGSKDYMRGVESSINEDSEF